MKFQQAYASASKRLHIHNHITTTIQYSLLFFLMFYGGGSCCSSCCCCCWVIRSCALARSLAKYFCMLASSLFLSHPNALVLFYFIFENLWNKQRNSKLARRANCIIHEIFIILIPLCTFFFLSLQPPFYCHQHSFFLLLLLLLYYLKILWTSFYLFSLLLVFLFFAVNFFFKKSYEVMV